MELTRTVVYLRGGAYMLTKRLTARLVAMRGLQIQQQRQQQERLMAPRAISDEDSTRNQQKPTNQPNMQSINHERAFFASLASCIIRRFPSPFLAREAHSYDGPHWTKYVVRDVDDKSPQCLGFRHAYPVAYIHTYIHPSVQLSTYVLLCRQAYRQNHKGNNR